MIAATNRDLEEAISVGAFREDLYYRLRPTRAVHLPPLRERPPEDLGAIWKVVTQRIIDQERLDLALPDPRPDECELLKEHRWRGNVREMDALAQEYVHLCEQQWELVSLGFFLKLKLKALEDLQKPGPDGATWPPQEVTVAAQRALIAGTSLRTLLEQLESQLVKEAMESAQGKYEEAASQLGLSAEALRKVVARKRPRLS